MESAFISVHLELQRSNKWIRMFLLFYPCANVIEGGCICISLVLLYIERNVVCLCLLTQLQDAVSIAPSMMT